MAAREAVPQGIVRLSLGWPSAISGKNAYIAPVNKAEGTGGFVDQLGGDGLPLGDRAAPAVLGDHDGLAQPPEQQCSEVFRWPAPGIGRRLALLEVRAAAACRSPPCNPNRSCLFSL